MRFFETAVAGAFLLEPERIDDERGFFARTVDAEELAQRGLASVFVQQSISFNARRGTLRGLHWQTAPHAEIKLVRCTAGAVFDVIVDMRRDSPTFRRWHGVELSAESRRTLYVPADVAHGFQTLSDGAELFYQMSESYRAELQRGVRWDDPAFAVDWPDGERIISPRDLGFEAFVP